MRIDGPRMLVYSQNLRYSTEYTVLLLMWSLLPYLDYTNSAIWGSDSGGADPLKTYHCLFSLYSLSIHLLPTR